MSQPARLPRQPAVAERPRANAIPRKRRNGREREQARELEQRLARLQDEFPNIIFYDILQEAIVRLNRISTREARHLRDEVLRSICVGGCRLFAEILEETQLSRHVADGVLTELALDDLVEIREQPASRRDPAQVGPPLLEYHPTRLAESLFNGITPLD